MRSKRPNFPYLWRNPVKKQTKTGVRRYVYWNYRRDGVTQRILDPQTDLPIGPEHPAFLDAYMAIHKSFEQETPPETTGFKRGQLGYIIQQWLNSPAVTQLSARTQKDYKNYGDYLADKFGSKTARTLPREFIIGLKDKYAHKPRRANHLLTTLRIALCWAEDRPQQMGLPGDWKNPSRRPGLIKSKGHGHRPWEEYEIAAFQRNWEVGSRERAMFETYINTGQRTGDVASMTRNHRHLNPDQSRWIEVVQNKTATRLLIFEAPDLTRSLDAWLKTHNALAFFPGKTGEPMLENSIQHIMRAAITKAGLPSDCTLHGLRYTAATRFDEIGQDATNITGHETVQMARKYTAQRRQSRLGISKMVEAIRQQTRNTGDSD